jgi:hypothetical protein
VACLHGLQYVSSITERAGSFGRAYEIVPS